MIGSVTIVSCFFKMHRGYQTAGNSDLQQAHLASEEGILLREMVDMNNLFKKSEVSQGKKKGCICQTN